MHFYESMVIASKDGMQLKSYANEHPDGFVIAKPKYIPRDKLSLDAFQARDLQGVAVNRFDYWAANEQQLQDYIRRFRAVFPAYVHDSPLHNRWFFGVPLDRIQHAPDPREGVRRIISSPAPDLYLQRTQEFLHILHDIGIRYRDMGVTNSTLLGTYTHGRSDIDIMLFGKKAYWEYFHAIGGVSHPLLRWRTLQEWQKYYASYNAGLNFSEAEFIWQAQRKRGDGLFDDIVFSVFGVEEPGETAVPWGAETYEPLGMATVKGVVADCYHSIVRPGFYQLDGAKVTQGRDVPVTRVVTFARDFMAQAFTGETVAAHGVLERVTPQEGKPYHRIVVGYFDSYVQNRGTEFIKVWRPHGQDAGHPG